VICIVIALSLACDLYGEGQSPRSTAAGEAPFVISTKWQAAGSSALHLFVGVPQRTLAKRCEPFNFPDQFS